MLSDRHARRMPGLEGAIHAAVGTDSRHAGAAVGEQVALAVEDALAPRSDRDRQLTVRREPLVELAIGTELRAARDAVASPGHPAAEREDLPRAPHADRRHAAPQRAERGEPTAPERAVERTCVRQAHDRRRHVAREVGRRRAPDAEDDPAIPVDRERAGTRERHARHGQLQKSPARERRVGPAVVSHARDHGDPAEPGAEGRRVLHGSGHDDARAVEREAVPASGPSP